MERGRFRQGLRSNPQGLALTGSHARLGLNSFGGKMGGCDRRPCSTRFELSTAVVVVGFRSGFFARKPDRWLWGWYAGGGCPLSASLCIVDCSIQPLNVLSIYRADDSAAAGSPQDHKPMLV